MGQPPSGYGHRHTDRGLSSSGGGFITYDIIMVRLTILECLLAVLCAVMPQPAQAKGKIKTARKARAAVAADTLSDEARRRYDMFFLEALMCRERGENTAAFDLLRYCAELNPQASEVYFYLAQYYGGLKDKEKALAYFKRATDLNPDNATYLETLAQAYVNSNRFDEAIAVLEKLSQTEKGRDDVLSMLVQLYLQKADYDNAIATLDRLELLEGKSERMSYAKCEIYTKQGNMKAAIAEMKSLADQYPNDLNYLGMYGDMLLMGGEEKKALDIFSGILAEEPDNSRAQMSMRHYYLQKNDTAAADSMTLHILLNRNTATSTRIYLMRQEISAGEEAGGDSTRVLDYFRRMAEMPQEDADMAEMQATYMGMKKMPEDSINPVLERILAIEPDNAWARLRLVSYAWEANDLDRVIELCKAARQYNPDNMGFYYYQGMAYYRKDDNDNALSTFQNGVSVINDESSPELVSEFYSVMGELLHSKGLREEAYAAYDSCLQWKGDNISCLNNYAYYLSIEDGDLDKAERMSYKTIKAEPDNGTYLDTYAWILFLRGRTAEAKVYIEQAVRNDADGSAVILEHAGDIYAVSGDIDRALEMWRQAADKDPDNKLLNRKIKQKKYIK